MFRKTMANTMSIKTQVAEISLSRLRSPLDIKIPDKYGRKKW